jgi:LuxR family maltose regulon positive regulatory protein
MNISMPDGHSGIVDTTAVVPTAKSWVLAGKLGPPRQRLNTAPRGRLLERLDRALALPLTVLISPAGFGKSTLLSQWYQHLVERGEVHVAWVSLEEDDGEISRFVAYLTLAISRAGIDVGPLLQTVQTQLHDIDARAAIAALVEYVRAAGCGLVIVLDDYDRVRSEAVDGLVLDLVQHGDPRLHVLLSGREAPRLPLAQLGSRGLVERIGAAEMALSLDEAETMLVGGRLSRDAVGRLHGYTEGWAVALQLAALWLAAQPGELSGEELLDRFSGRSAEMAAYLTEQVVESLDDQARGFILQTSVLERFNVALANAVRQQGDSGAHLQRLGSFQGLLIPLDNEQEWFRYHHLFAQYLQTQLQRQYPYEVDGLHRRAALWQFEHGDLIEAVKHAIRADDIALATGFVERADGWELILWRGLGYVRPLLRHFDRQTIRDTPVLNVTQAYLHVKLGQFGQAEELLERYRDLPEGPFQSNWPGYIAVVSLLYNYRDLIWSDRGRTRLVASYLDKVGERGLVRPTLHCVCASGDLCSGDFTSAERHAIDAARQMQQAGNIIGVAYALFHQGLACFYTGRLDEAEALYVRALVIAEQHFGIDSALKACAECLLAQLLCYRGQWQQAAELLERGVPFIETHDGWLDVLAAAYEARLIVAARSGAGLRERLSLLDHCENFAVQRRLNRLQQLAVGWRLQVLLDAQAGTAADLMVADTGCEADMTHFLADDRHWRQQMALGAALTAWHQRRGRAGAALELLEAMEQGCERTGRRLHLAQVRAQRALVQQQRGELEAAFGPLGQALEYVAREQAWHALLVLGRPLRTLLHLAQQRDPHAVSGTTRGNSIHQLLQRLGADHGGEAEAAADGALNTREREILSELCRGHSNKEIGRLLNLSENTVKFHLKRLFRKLNVETRGEAVAVAIKQGVAG